jgi:predicted Zn finger-like uncharacterized protein
MANESMIAGCPRCGARYRVERARLRSEGVRMRCTRCEAVFRVTPPPAARALPEAAEPAAAPPPAEPRGEEARRSLVLVADADVQAGKALAHTLVGWGLEPLLVHDGVEAILAIQRALPRAVVLDAALPKMFGFQVCELLKRNESLRAIQVVLLGAIHHRERYRREPHELYGADAYVERHQLPDALRPILERFGFELRAGAPTPATPAAPARPAEPARPPAREKRPAAPARPLAAPAAAAPAAAAPAAAAPVDPAVAAAERLARIIVSDVVLYNPEKFAEGLRAGDVAERLEAELAEGRSLFEQRVEARLRAGRDFLVEELLRVARARGMKG